jgi:tetratricopeptide (TPR) repeat protein
MIIDCTGIRPASKRRGRLVPVLAALLALGAARSASAQTIGHDLMEGRGRDVSFPVSCGADIQPRFDAALAALHSFWYGQALKEFTAIAESKPDCAMAYWGIAMSVWNQIWAPPTPANLKKGSEAITQALALGGKTPRERDYLEALAAFYADHDKLDHRTRATVYMRKMEQVAQRYPDDREARIFYALSLLATADGLDKTYKNQLKAGEILEQVFAEKPQHPGPSHYIIHAYDYPALVDRALAAAQNYAVCVTVVPHAIHMPSHTYVLLGRWKDTITANDSAETAEADRGTPEDRIHALDYLVYAHLQLAQDAKAKETLDLALKIENDLIARKHDSGLRARPFGVAAMEARWALQTCRRGRAATHTRNRCRISRAPSGLHAAAGRSKQAPISSGSRSCRKRWRTPRTCTGQDRSPSSTR